MGAPKWWSKGRAWRTWIEGSSKGEMVRRATSLFSMMVVMLLVGSGVALAEVFTGTDGPDTYTGPVDDDSISGLDGEDFGLKVNGGAAGYEVGWFNAGTREVVPTWGEAAGAPLGRAGRILLDRG